MDVQERQGSATGPKTRFLMRQRIPKNSNHPLSDEEQKTGKTGFITMDDLAVGERVSIFGKNVFIYDADDFTKKYYASQFGKSLGSIEIDEPTVPIPRLPTPPSNGLGQEEDSIQNCKMLRPKPAYRDMFKYKKYAGKVMRFTARWDSERPDENSRSFIISFYPSDDTVSIWETSGDGRNTGMSSGKFLERMKLTKPGTSGTRLKYYSKDDFVVGATIMAQGRKFVLTSMDEFTARLMDNDDNVSKKRQAPAAVRLAQRIGDEKNDLLKKCHIKDRHSTGLLSIEDFMALVSSKLHGMTNNDIMDLMELCKSDDRDFSGEVKYQDFFDRVFDAHEADKVRRERKLLHQDNSKGVLRLPNVDGQRPGTNSDAMNRTTSPNTKESVQWADRSSGQNLDIGPDDGYWKFGDIDEYGNQAEESIIARGEEGDNIDWASGNQFF